MNPHRTSMSGLAHVDALERYLDNAIQDAS